MLQQLRATGLWWPTSASFIVRSALWGRADVVPSDADALRGAAEWIGRAQDATPDGGIAGRYSLARGWTSSYPETTGYTVPTLLALATALNDQSYHARAARCVEFLLSVQLPDGAFPAAEIAENRTRPSAFNSAQIVHGLQCWHQATGDSRALDAMVKAARWICDAQDADGAWRAHFYQNLACTYSAHAACWLAELGAYTGEATFTRAASRNLVWVLRHRDPVTGWFDACGFSEADHRARRALTHTIAYTLWGILLMAQRLRVAEGVEAVCVAAEALMHRLERSRTLPGILNHEWRACTKDVCLTGNAQLAVLWLHLADMTGDLRYVNTALQAIDEVKQSQLLDGAAGGIRGGVPGSRPVGGQYIPFALPNWAAKFLIDALLAKRRCLSEWPARAPAVHESVVEMGSSANQRSNTRRAALGVVVYTSRVSPMFVRLSRDWHRQGFTPSLVVIEAGPRYSPRRLASSLKHPTDDSATVCRRLGWRFRRVEHLNGAEAVAAVAAVSPDLAVNTASSILRSTVLAIPRLGTIGVHMGLLPLYRGMNVAEWAALRGDHVGCSVFRLDGGIDTGDIVATAVVDIIGCQSRSELRARVDDRQMALLGETLADILARGELPHSKAQRPEDGQQFYRMHQDLLRILDAQLAAAATVSTAAC